MRVYRCASLNAEWQTKSCENKKERVREINVSERTSAWKYTRASERMWVCLYPILLYHSCIIPRHLSIDLYYIYYLLIIMTLRIFTRYSIIISKMSNLIANTLRDGGGASKIMSLLSVIVFILLEKSTRHFNYFAWKI